MDIDTAGPDLVASRATLETDGVTVLRGLFADWVAPLRRAMDDVMRSPGPLARNHAPSGATGRFFTDIYMWRHHPVFRAFAFESPAGAVAAALMGSRRVVLYNEHLLVKEAGADAPTPWHQDQPYFRFAGRQNCSMWIALAAVDADSGAMRFAAGSHRWGKVFNPASFSDGGDVGNAFDGPAPDLDARPGEVRIVSYDLAPGDCTVHHGLTLHGARPNASMDRVRPGLSYRFTGDDCRYRRNAYSSPLPHEPGLDEGDDLACDLFPQVWPRDFSLMP